MANVKISELTQVTTLDNNDVLPIVNGGETKKVTVQQIVDSVPTSGIKDINTVTLDGSTAGATAIKISKDNQGNDFECSHIEGTAILHVDTSQIASANYTLRIRTDNGTRYLALRSMAKKNYIVIGFITDYINGITLSITNYQPSDDISGNQIQGTSGSGYNTVSNKAGKFKDIEIYLVDGSTNIPLLEGSFLSIRGY